MKNHEETMTGTAIEYTKHPQCNACMPKDSKLDDKASQSIN